MCNHWFIIRNTLIIANGPPAHVNVADYIIPQDMSVPGKYSIDQHAFPLSHPVLCLYKQLW